MRKQQMMSKLDELKELVKLDDCFYTPLDEDRVIIMIDDLKEKIT